MPKSKKKIRPPRLYVAKDGRYYIKISGKKVYLKTKLTGNKLKKVVVKNMTVRPTTSVRPTTVVEPIAKRKYQRAPRGRKRNYRDPNLDIQSRVRAQAQKELIDKLQKEKFELLAEAEKQLKKAEEKLRDTKREREAVETKQAILAISPAPPVPTALIKAPKARRAKRKEVKKIEKRPERKREDVIEVEGKTYGSSDILEGIKTLKRKDRELIEQREKTFEARVRTASMKPYAKALGIIKPGSRKEGYAQATRDRINQYVPADVRWQLAVAPEARFEQSLMSYIESKKAADEKEAKGEGHGGDGLYTSEIDRMMADEPMFLGTVSADEISELDPEGKKRFGFITNTDTSDGPGEHWVAIFVDVGKDRSIEYYDPLADEPNRAILKSMKKLVDRLSPDTYLKMKINKIKNQDDNTDTCGYHSMRFLKERFGGAKWKFATGYTDLKEDEIAKFKKKLGRGFQTYI